MHMSNIFISKILSFAPSTAVPVFLYRVTFSSNIVRFDILYNIFQFNAVTSWLTKKLAGFF